MIIKGCIIPVFILTFFLQVLTIKFLGFSFLLYLTVILFVVKRNFNPFIVLKFNPISYFPLIIVSLIN